MVLTNISLIYFILILVTSENDSSEINLEQKREQLNFAFEWKRIDIIKNFIMKNDSDWKVNESHLEGF